MLRAPQAGSRQSNSPGGRTCTAAQRPTCAPGMGSLRSPPPPARHRRQLRMVGTLVNVCMIAGNRVNDATPMQSYWWTHAGRPTHKLLVPSRDAVRCPSTVVRLEPILNMSLNREDPLILPQCRLLLSDKQVCDAENGATCKQVGAAAGRGFCAGCYASSTCAPRSSCAAAQTRA